MATTKLPPRVEVLIRRLRTDPSADETRDSIRALVPDLPEKRALRGALQQLQYESDDDDFVMAMDEVLELIPPSDDWIWVRNKEKWRPGMESVVKRTLCAGVIFWRAVEECGFWRDFEKLRRKPSRSDLTFVQELSEWGLDNLGEELTKDEIASLQRAAWKWTLDEALERVNTAYCFELLGWALELLPIRALDQSFDAEKILEQVQCLRQGTCKPRLRSLEALMDQTEDAHLWKKRASLQPIRNPAAMKGLLRRLGWRFPEGSLEAKYGDPVAFGKPCWSLRDDELNHVATVARYRYLTGTWLCGGYYEWDDTRD